MRLVASLASLVAVVGLAVMGCSAARQPDGSAASASQNSKVTPVPSPQAGPGVCAASGVELVQLPSRTPGEPKMALPRPQGWEYEPADNGQHSRGFVVNKKETTAAHGFRVTASAGMESFARGERMQTPQQAIDAELVGLQQGGNDIKHRLAGTLCGYPSETIECVLRPFNSLQIILIVGAEDGPKIWAASAMATITTTATTPGAVLDSIKDADFMQDVHTILHDFQFQLPARA